MAFSFVSASLWSSSQNINLDSGLTWTQLANLCQGEIKKYLHLWHYRMSLLQLLEIILRLLFVWQIHILKNIYACPDIANCIYFWILWNRSAQIYRQLSNPVMCTFLSKNVLLAIQMKTRLGTIALLPTCHHYSAY